MSAIVGIDWSTFALDVVLLDEDDPAYGKHFRRRLDTAPGDALTRLRRIPDVMPPRGSWLDDVLIVGIEKPMMRGAGRGADVMQYALGALIACLPATLELRLLRADDWRRTCGLKTRAPRADHKAAALRFAGEHWANHPPLDDNIADAYCVAHATLTTTREEQ